jgi:hypothetical protein
MKQFSPRVQGQASRILKDVSIDGKLKTNKKIIGLICGTENKSNWF